MSPHWQSLIWLAVLHRLQASTDADLGLEGSFSINGEAISVSITDALSDVMNSINKIYS